MVHALTNELSGRRLGEFVLREPIGEGGFGMVYRAEQPMLEREAVVKIAQVRALGGDPAVQRFLGEARLASRLDHPFAAHVYAFGAEPDGLLWIAMELVRGTPLDAMLSEAGPLPLERAIPFLIRLCEVVHSVHEQGVVHRDLKPANVMVVARAGSVFPKLLDLGIAADLRASATPSGAEEHNRTVGTPLYMAPEMWLDARKAGPPADIYALGALTYEVLSGKPPFTGRSVMEIAALHARKAPPALGEPFPPGIDAAIAKAMAKRVPNRYATALELGEALREASGFALEGVNLPQLDELTRDELITRAPQPIAEAVAALDAARTPPQAREALWHAVRSCTQYIGLVALACHVRVAGKPNDTTLLEQLRDQGLDAAGWWKLARELCRPFAAIADAHPMPELVGLFFEDRAVLRTAMEILLDTRIKDPGPNANAGDIRKFLVGAVSALASALRALKFLQAYRLVVTTETHGEEWMGVRRPARAAVTLAASIPKAADRVLLVDANGALVAALDLVAQPGPPSPSAAPELFWLDGTDRQGLGARFVAVPTRLERRDVTAWAKLSLEATTSDGGATGTREDTVPFRGLMTFTEADASVFFGREREIEGFVNRLRAMPLIAVVGPSGAGKSSFVRAGVLPALGSDWRSLVARPGPTPLANLCARIATLEVRLEPAKILADPSVLGSSLRTRARAEGTSLLIVIDQFEELFTLCRDPAEQDAYATALIQAARLDDETVRVVITLRDDFLVRAAQLAAFRERLAASLQLLTTPVASDLLRILVEPARRAGYEFEDAKLPKQMVDEVENQPAALALLSFTAYQLWQFRDREFHQLPRKAYKALGGVGGALAQHAEATLAAMSGAEQKIVREVFR
nr:serine/threonine-protein kinase PknK [Deltaproteobacteria bacterium]